MTDNDRAQLAALDERRKPGRPPKGDTTRTARLSLRVVPAVVQAVDDARQDEESRADVVTRWALEER